MVRPRRRRRIQGSPEVTYFKPNGVPKCELEIVPLEMDEFEAIRLKDLEELDQKTAAQEMKISQPTFHRLLNSAHAKIADAIINGKAVEIRNT
ncbi:DUF134 domain-containing protein [Candidatus Peregrinibacteria bacterium]|jgi:uncharacterized protein|nr:DUF134 domain-containing protein [Candidatus Peregrinibacteria bacterium]MBT7484528.1 DUF134 domain-containing protein [Candidatus Peregrinibacteria bacterium]MBT7703764.1 DUF134 domain-containing protein [Candidatus Peregrinibacteria bacterium]